MQKQIAPMLWIISAGIMMWLPVQSVTAGMQNSTNVLSSFDTVKAPVLKVYSAEEAGHRFVAYLVKWKNSEIIVSDPLARSHFQEGDNISFIVQKVSLPGSTIKVSSLNFTLLPAISSAADKTDPYDKTVSAAYQKRQMKIAQGDLGAAKSETERFYALNHASKNAWRKNDIEKARALATEMERLIPKYRNDWNYGNAVQDANQVLGLIALRAGDVAEAKKRLLASADSKGSPQMNTFGPNMQLAKSLLEKGEKDVVLEYFKRCGTFWRMGKTRLSAWSESVKNGEIPKFGANLKY